MYKYALVYYCLSLIAPAHAETPLTDITFIELLGEFDEEDTLLLEASMEAVNKQITTDEDETKQTGASNEDTAK